MKSKQIIKRSAELLEEQPETIRILNGIKSMISPYKDIQWRMVFEIPYSKSAKFEQVHKIIKEDMQYSEHESYIKVLVDQDNITNINKLFKLVKNWKGLKIKWYDEIIDKQDFASWIRCFRDRVKYKGINDFFCFGASIFTANIFGCHRTMIRETPVSNQPAWWDQGAFKGDIFYIDKPAICNHIHDKLKPFRFCPALEYLKIERAIKAMPYKVHPQSDKIFNRVGSQIIPEMISLEIIDGKTYKISEGLKELEQGIYFPMPSIPVSPFYLAVIDTIIKESYPDENLGLIE